MVYVRYVLINTSLLTINSIGLGFCMSAGNDGHSADRLMFVTAADERLNRNESSIRATNCVFTETPSLRYLDLNLIYLSTCENRANNFSKLKYIKKDILQLNSHILSGGFADRKNKTFQYLMSVRFMMNSCETFETRESYCRMTLMTS